MTWASSLYVVDGYDLPSPTKVLKSGLVGWRLVERRQLSCVSCLGGVGDNVMFTLRLTRLLVLRSALLQVTSNTSLGATLCASSSSFSHVC